MVLNIWVKYMNKNANKLERIVIILIASISSYFNFNEENQTSNISNSNKISYEISNIPEYNGKVYIQINNNVPKFSTEDMNIEEDYYSILENGKVRDGNGKNQLGKGQ